MAEPQSLPGRTRRPRPRRAIKRLVIWYRRTGPVIRLVNTANSALGPLRLGQTRPGGASAVKGPRLSIAVDGMGGDYAPGPILEGCLGAIEELPLKVMFFAEEKPLQAAIKALELEEAVDQAVAKGHLELIASGPSVGMDDEATSVRRKRQASINLAMDRVKAGEALAV